MKDRIEAYAGPHAADDTGAGIVAIDRETGHLLGSDTGAEGDWWVAAYYDDPSEEEDYSVWCAGCTGASTANGDALDHPDFAPFRAWIGRATT